jgi:DNA-binding LytR/AlgR family response regulator
MTALRAPTALIAEDEPLLAQALARELAAAWPELHIVASVGDGLSAVREALALHPDLLFFDVRMPGLSGLDAAADIADQWPDDKPLPLLVFITAYDEYAVQAFERAAVDYLLKPLQPARLQQSLERIKPLAQHNIEQAATNNVANGTPATAFNPTPNPTPNPTSNPTLSPAPYATQTSLDQLRALLSGQATSPPAPLLQRLQVSVGNTIAIVPIDEVLYFEAADKYVRVLTASKEYLIRTPIKDLLPQLDTQVFWQIHRSTVVRASAVQAVHRDEAGRLRVQLSQKTNGQSESLAVSRLFAHLFKAM